MKIKIVFGLAILLANQNAVAVEEDSYNYNELSIGLDGSSIKKPYRVTYSHSRSLSDTFYMTTDLSKGVANKFDQYTGSSAEVGIGGHMKISESTDAYIELAYSKKWEYRSNYKLDSLHIKTGAITDISDNFELITESSINKSLSNKHGFFNQKPEIKYGFELAGKFNIKKNAFVTGLSSTKGFPFFGMSFK